MREERGERRYERGVLRGVQGAGARLGAVRGGTLPYGYREAGQPSTLNTQNMLHNLFRDQHLGWLGSVLFGGGRFREATAKQVDTQPGTRFAAGVAAPNLNA